MIYPIYHVEKEIEVIGFHTLSEMTFQGGYHFPGDQHDFWECLFVIDGEMCASSNDGIFYLGKNDIIFYRPMELHKFHIEEDKQATLLIMTFTLNGNLTTRLEGCVLHLSPEQQNALTLLRTYLHTNCGIDEDPEVCLQKTLPHPVIFQKLTGLTEQFLLSLSSNGEPVSGAEETPEIHTFTRAIQFMEDHLAEWLTVPDVARECSVSVSYLKKIFAKYAGFGVHQYFMKRKLNKASRMLKSGLSVSQVANKLSFSSPNYFSTVYKREMGISPFTYKRLPVDE